MDNRCLNKFVLFPAAALSGMEPWLRKPRPTWPTTTTLTTTQKSSATRQLSSSNGSRNRKRTFSTKKRRKNPRLFRGSDRPTPTPTSTTTSEPSSRFCRTRVNSKFGITSKHILNTRRDWRFEFSLIEHSSGSFAKQWLVWAQGPGLQIGLAEKGMLSGPEKHL